MNNFIKHIYSNSSFLCRNWQSSNNLFCSLQKTNIEIIINFSWLFVFNLNNCLVINELIYILLYYNGNFSYSLFSINNHLESSNKSGYYYPIIFLKALKILFSLNDETESQVSSINPSLYNDIFLINKINNLLKIVIHLFFLIYLLVFIQGENSSLSEYYLIHYRIVFVILHHYHPLNIILYFFEKKDY